MSVNTDASIGPRIDPKPNPPVFIPETIACNFYFSWSFTGLCSSFSIAIVSVKSIAGVVLLFIRAAPIALRAMPLQRVLSLLKKKVMKQ